MPRDELTALLETLDPETRKRWESFLAEVDADITERGPSVVREHLEEALRHLLAVGWAVHRCYSEAEAKGVMEPIGDAAAAVEFVRSALDEVAKKPEWSH